MKIVITTFTMILLTTNGRRCDNALVNKITMKGTKISVNGQRTIV